MLVAIDLETACDVEGCPWHGHSICQNDHSLSPWHSRITVAALAFEDGSSKVIRDESSRMIAYSIEKELERIPDYRLTGQNFKFDLLHLYRHGFPVDLDRWDGDSQLAAFVLTEKIPDAWLLDYEAQRLLAGSHHRRAGKHSLKTLAPYFLGVPAFWETDGHDDDDYVSKDALYTLQLTIELEKRLKTLDQFDFYKKLLGWTKMLLAAEMRGFNLSLTELAQMESELRSQSAALKAQLDNVWAKAHKVYYDLKVGDVTKRYVAMAQAAVEKLKKPEHSSKAEVNLKRTQAYMQKRIATFERYGNSSRDAINKIDRDLSYDSPTQMTWLLKTYLGYDIRGFDGEESTGAEVLERLAFEGHEDVAIFLQWRKTNKILSSYIPVYKELTVDGVIHPIYNVTSTSTGRTSSERPNIQQVSPLLKPLFKARPGYKLLIYDAAAIEARLIALYTEDPTLYKIIDSGISLHDHNTKVYFELGDEVPYSDIKKKHGDKRSASKNVGFALFYHAGWNRIRIAMAESGFHFTEQQCRAIHKRVKREYETAFYYAGEVVKLMERGEILSNLLGRPLIIENPEDAYMKAFNKLIQSSASDLILEGSFKAWEEMNANSLDAHPIAFVHDMAAFEVLESDVERANEILIRSLVNFDLQTSHGPIKLEVEGGISASWKD